MLPLQQRNGVLVVHCQLTGRSVQQEHHYHVVHCKALLDAATCHTQSVATMQSVLVAMDAAVLVAMDAVDSDDELSNASQCICRANTPTAHSTRAGIGATKYM